MRMIRESRLTVDNLVYPLFITFGKDVKKPISSMPGNFQMSVDHLVHEAHLTKDPGIPAIILAGFKCEFFR